jgi:sirohydrochlorin ferrochelatase
MDMSKVRIGLVLLALAVPFRGTAFGQQQGVLLLAHGGHADWNAQVTKLASEVDRTKPTEVAFGMATRANIQAAVDRLKARGVSEIVAVPLFVSSWSSVITSTEYLLGQRTEAPRELALFAKMSHGPSGHGGSAHGTSGHDAHANHAASAAPDPTSPVNTSVPVRMTPALNDHPIVAEILTTRAASVSSDPDKESVIIVAHGPTADAENEKWLKDMAVVAGRVKPAGNFASIDYMTLRDDAPKPVRDEGTAQLRAIVSKRIGEGRRVLIVPLLVSFGGIERGLRERLEGLNYTMPASGLVPDDRLVSRVLAMSDNR